MLILTVHVATAQDAVLIAEDMVQYGRLGSSVAVDDAYVFAGNGVDAVYVYAKEEAGTWVETQKLVMTIKLNNGHAVKVAADSDRLLIGVWDNSNDRGGAYIYVNKPGVGWVLDTELIPDGFEPDTTYAGIYFPNSNYGAAVALEGDYALVGAPGQIYSTRPGLGTVFVFRKDASEGWIQHARLTASPTSQDDGFGASVSISDDLILVGAPTHFFSFQLGSAYVFHLNPEQQWTQVAKLQPSDGQPNDAFGASVDIHDHHALVGAPSFSKSYIFHTTAPEQWIEKARWEPPGGEGFFGASVALQGRHALIGSARTLFTGGLTGGGIAYLYSYDAETDTWATKDQFTASSLGSSDGHGAAVALNNDLLVVGAPYQNHAVAQEGSVYLYPFQASGTTIEPVPSRVKVGPTLSSFPNPSHGFSTIQFSVSEGAPALTEVAVFDLLGRKKVVLLDGVLAAGDYSVNWAADILPNGVYLCQLRVGGTVTSHKVVLLQ